MLVVILWWVLVLGLLGTLAYRRASLLIFTGALAIFLALFTFLSPAGWFLKAICWVPWFALALLNVKPLRKSFITASLFKRIKAAMPTMSSTEKEALEAGTVGWEGELFSGAPNWTLLHNMAKPELTEEEQAFLDGPVEALCDMIDDWDITHQRFDLPEDMWAFIKQQGFFGLIIPKAFGGKGFSALAHSEILTKLASRSATVSSTVSVPNALGPAELLLHYGTEEQKDYYLPRLAEGQEIPCFALTSPEAGSDAASMPDRGIVCREKVDGKDVLGIRLNFDKRYITLAPIATVIGLAFKLYDPAGLLGDKESLGITCALLPRDTKGITIGRRHFPLNIAFQNGPIQGKDVFIPLEAIIGGEAMIGQGWRMLMECLACGRAISLPATAVGGSRAALLNTSAYARIRRQFNMAIGRFEGIEEVLARMAGLTYIMEGVRQFTANTIDQGEKPSVPSAITKYHLTEAGRQVAMDAMDIQGGKGICLGKSNVLGRSYQGVPISITVEGANILTRSLIIFGQGAVRCHPFILREMYAVANEDTAAGLQAFDDILFAHMGHVISNAVRAFSLGLTGGRLLNVAAARSTQRYYGQLTRFSAAFALMADSAMLLLGGSLKRREKLSGRLADIFSQLYMCSAVLKHFKDNGSLPAEAPFMHWASQFCLYRIQQGLDELLNNFPHKILRRVLRVMVLPLGRRLKAPKDSLGTQLVNALLAPSALRENFAKNLHQGDSQKGNPLALFEESLAAIVAAEPIEKKFNKLVKAEALESQAAEAQVEALVRQKLFTAEEAKLLREIWRVRARIIAVDDFAPEELSRVMLATTTEKKSQVVSIDADTPEKLSKTN